MSAVNQGNQYITFDYKHPAKGADFNTLLRDGIQPGIYEGGELTKLDDSTIQISPFTAYVQISTDKLVRVVTRSTVDVSVSNTSNLIYLSYSWVEAIDNWLDFNTRLYTDSPVTNEVVLGHAVFSGTTISGISYDYTNYGPIQELEYQTGESGWLDALTKYIKLQCDEVGDIKMTGAATAGDNWALCNGGELSRTDYSELFSKIGTTFGAGDGSTTFNLPNFQGVVPKGVGSQDINGRTKTGPALGVAEEDQMQDHKHLIDYAISNHDTCQTGSKQLREHARSITANMLANTIQENNGNGTPRVGATTRENSLGINFKIKIK